MKFFRFFFIIFLLSNIDFAYCQTTSTPPNATSIRASTTNFDSNLSPADYNVQRALDTLDEVSGAADGLGAATALTSQTEITSTTTDDVMYIIDDTSGTPVKRKITVGNLFTTTTAGTATYALSLYSNPSNCPEGSYPLGIAASGTVENCTTEHEPLNLVDQDHGYVTLNGTTQTMTINDVTLATDTTGSYISSATAGQGLTMTGTEDGSIGLQDCSANQILKRNAGDTAWECQADNTTGGGGLAPGDASYLVVSLNGTLSAERSIVPTTGNTNDGIITTDAGAGSTFTLAIDLKTAGEDAVGTTNSVSGMEFESEELTLLQGCADNDILKWDEATDAWHCEADGGAGISGTDTYVLSFIGTNNPAGDSGFTYDAVNNIATLTGSLVVANEPYDSTDWDGENDVPTKNAVRDEIEAVKAAGIGAVTDGGSIVYVTDTVASFASEGSTSAATFYADATTDVFKAEGGFKSGTGAAGSGQIAIHTLDLDITDPVFGFDADGLNYYTNYALVVGGTQSLLQFDPNDETIDNVTDDMIEFQGVGGSDNTDIKLDVDGTMPIWESPTDSSIGFREAAVYVGPVTDTDIYFYALNADASKPAIRYYATGNVWQFSNDGVAFSDMGSGAGSGDGCWETNGNGDLMPVATTCTDSQWEENGDGDLMPKE